MFHEWKEHSQFVDITLAKNSDGCLLSTHRLHTPKQAHYNAAPIDWLINNFKASDAQILYFWNEQEKFGRKMSNYFLGAFWSYHY